MPMDFFMSPKSAAIAELPHAQRERLAFIDFSLQYFGHISRQELIQRFATGLAASTRDFTTYRELAPDNLRLDHQLKRYRRTEEFEALFSHDPQVILNSLSLGFGDGIASAVTPSAHCVNAVSLIHPKPDIIAGLTRAIHNQYPIEAEYVSVTSGQKNRLLVPHAIVNNGHRWHVRAYDCDSQSFRDFVCTRFIRVTAIDRALASRELAEQDLLWQQHVRLVLIPHPGLANSRAIALDYAMQDGRKEVTIRAALAAYLLRYWQVDCSPGAQITGQGCQLALANPDILTQIDSAHLAPGAGRGTR